MIGKEGREEEEDPNLRVHNLQPIGEDALNTVLLVGMQQPGFLQQALRSILQLSHPHFMEPLKRIVENHPMYDEDEEGGEQPSSSAIIQTVCIVCLQTIGTDTPMIWTSKCCERTLMCDPCFRLYRRETTESSAKVNKRCVCAKEDNHWFDAKEWYLATEWFWRGRAARFFQLPLE